MAPTPKDKSQGGICLITGYGPFRGFPVNPSYESVRNLQARKFRSGDNQEVFCKVLEIPTEYERVHDITPHFFDTVPRFILHVGAHGRLPSGVLQLECACRSGPYDKRDVCNMIPKTKRAVPWEGCEEYQEPPADCADDNKENIWEGRSEDGFDSHTLPEKLVQNIAAGFSKRFENVQDEQKWTLQTSMDAGLYLCEFIFYSSTRFAKLHGMDVPVFFLHVPPIDVEKGYRSAEELGKAVEELVKVLCQVC